MTGIPEIPITKEDVLQNIRDARAELNASFQGLSDEQLTGPRNEGGWSIKDHLAHIAEWQRRGLAVLAGKTAREGLQIDEGTYQRLENVHEINELLFQRHRDDALQDVLDDFHATHQQVELMIDAMTDADLQQELPQEIKDRYPRAVDLANKFADHDRVHIPDIEALAQQS